MISAKTLDLKSVCLSQRIKSQLIIPGNLACRVSAKALASEKLGSPVSNHTRSAYGQHNSARQQCDYDKLASHQV
jgi:hypothetical protein